MDSPILVVGIVMAAVVCYLLLKNRQQKAADAPQTPVVPAAQVPTSAPAPEAVPVPAEPVVSAPAAAPVPADHSRHTPPVPTPRHAPSTAPAYRFQGQTDLPTDRSVWTAPKRYPTEIPSHPA